MEPTLTGTPLDALHAVYLDLTAKLEARLVGIDDAMRELQAHEVVDAAGRTWRIDPITKSFIRLSAEPGAMWQSADSSEYAEEAHAHRISAPQTVPDLPQGLPQPTPATQYMLPVAGAAARAHPSTPAANGAQPDSPPAEPPPLTRPARRPTRPPPLSYAVAGAVGLILVVVLILSLASPDEAESKGADSARPEGSAPAKAGKQQAPVAARANGMPSADRYGAVLSEVTSGDVDRASAMVAKSQFGANGRRMYAAMYAGWIDSGMTIKPNRPTGDASGNRATQTWELRRGSNVIATANVTWQRDGRDGRDGRGWRLAGWPEFRPAD